MTSKQYKWYNYMHDYVSLSPSTGTIEMESYEIWMQEYKLVWREDWDYYFADLGPDGVVSVIRFKSPQDAIVFKLRFQL